MSFRLALVIALAACGSKPTGPRLPRGPLASPLAAWVPADAALVVAYGPGGAGAVDEVTTALGWIGPGVLAAIDRSIALAWDDAGITPRSALWILWDDEARSTATCTLVGDQGHAAEALIAAGGARQVSEGADVIELGDTTTVIRGEVACVVDSGAPTRRAHHAMRLAGLTAEDRLLVSNADADRLLRALPAADVVVWGQGALIGGLVEVVPGPATMALAGLDVALAVAVDPATHQARITIATTVQPTPRPDQGTLSPGALALVPPAERPSELPIPAKDENTDVPFSPEYEAALRDAAQALADAAMTRQQHAELVARARSAFDAAWGSVTWRRSGDGEFELVDATWDPPAWPPAELRANATAAMEEALAGEPTLRADYERLVVEARQRFQRALEIRARDVAAWDRAH